MYLRGEVLTLNFSRHCQIPSIKQETDFQNTKQSLEKVIGNGAESVFVNKKVDLRCGKTKARSRAGLHDREAVNKIQCSNQPICDLT